MARESFATVALRRAYGLGFIVVILALVALSIAVYNKTFTKVVLVTLKADHTGNQLIAASDVKERGIIVGTVRKVKVASGADCDDPTGTCAVVTLALQPSRAGIIPKNVSAQILPKTLFGEQFVALQLPDRPDTHIRNGDTIPQDRSKGALETERVLGDILPLLQAVKPAELNATLSAMATALHGRGEKLGQTLVHLDQYLTQLNPDVPQLVDDLKKLGQVAVQFNDAAPDLVATLDNLQTSAHTLIDKRAALDTLLTTATSTSNILSSFLADNQQRLITVVDTTDKIYGLLNAYSPEFTCTFAGLNKLQARAGAAVTGGAIHLSVVLDIQEPGLGKYVAGNQPHLIDGIPPQCLGLPDPPRSSSGYFAIPPAYKCLNDGAALTADPCGGARATSGFEQQAIGSPAENSLVNTLIAATYGAAPDQVPSIATVLAAPALRGAQVSGK